MVSGGEQLDAHHRANISRDTAREVERTLSRHPAVDRVRLVGSQADGDPTPFSNWDFEVATHRLPSVARALPSLVRPLRPLAQQWDRLSRHRTYMLVLEGLRRSTSCSVGPTRESSHGR